MILVGSWRGWPAHLCGQLTRGVRYRGKLIFKVLVSALTVEYNFLAKVREVPSIVVT